MELVNSVGEYLALYFSFDSCAGGNCFEADSEAVGEFAAFGKEFLGDFGYYRPFQFTIYEYVVHFLSLFSR